jgi:multidrug efflux pump subunit AcrB
MRPADWALRHPWLPLVIICILAVFGLRAGLQMPLTYLPELGDNRIALHLEADNASLERMDKDLAQPVEQALAALPQITSIRSAVRPSGVELTLNLRDSRSAQDAVALVSDRINALIPDLDIAFRMNGIRALSSREQAAVDIAIVPRDRDILRASLTMRDIIRPALRKIDGLTDITVSGALRHGITIRPDLGRLEDADLTLDEVMQQIASGVGRITGAVMPTDPQAGTVMMRLSQYGPQDNATDVLDRLPLRSGHGSTVPLAAVAEVRPSATNGDWIARHDGLPALFVQVHVDPAADLGTVLTAIDDQLVQLAAKLPELQMDVVHRPADKAIASLAATRRALLEGAVLVIAVIALTLRASRATMLAACALPLSVLPTLFVMDLLGLSLNIVSLLALTLASGILVDDAIVEIENIHKYMARGIKARKAVAQAVHDIALPVIGTSLAILAVFAPVAAMPGEAGRYFWAFGSTLCIATIMSLAVSRLVIPPLAARFPDLAGNRATTRTGVPIARRYLGLLICTLRLRWLGVAAALLVAAGSIFAAMKHPGSFIPMDRSGTIWIELAQPSAMAPERRRQNLQELEKSLLGDQRVASVTMLFPAALDQNARLMIATDGSLMAEEAIRVILDAQPDMTAAILKANGLPKLAMDIAAPDRTMLETGVTEVIRAISNMEKAGRAPMVPGGWLPQIRLTTDPEILRPLGMKQAEIVRIMDILSMSRDTPLTYMDSPQQDGVPVFIDIGLMDPGPETAMPHLAFLGLRLPKGGTVPFAALGGIDVHLSSLALSRRDGLYVQRIIADPPDDAAGREIAHVAKQTMATHQNKLPGLVMMPAGDTALRQDMMRDLTDAMGSSLLLLTATLLVMFRSAGQTMVILVSLLFSLAGGMGVLVATGLPLSLPVLIGMLLLFGIVAKNGILLIDRAHRLHRGKMTMAQALVKATRDRTRPILMTSLAMIAGMIPAALPGLDGAAFRQPMALTVIGGVALSTVLSLLLLPGMALLAYQASIAARTLSVRNLRRSGRRLARSRGQRSGKGRSRKA